MSHVSVIRKPIYAAFAMMLGVLWLLNGEAAAQEEAAYHAFSQVSRSDLKRINKKLAALGYPVSSESIAWSPEAQNAMNRVRMRLGRTPVKTPREALAVLGDLNPRAAFPCPLISEAGPYEIVTLTFWGERPEEYLADFYDRLATCSPGLLAPRPGRAERLKPIPRREASPVIRAFPVHRTRQSVETYNKARRRLGNAMAKGDDNAPRYVDPGLQVDVIDAPLTVNLTPAGRSPSTQDIQDACRRLGYAHACFGDDEIRKINPPQRKEPIYLAEAAHFELKISLALPKQSVSTILTDAVDTVMTRHGMLNYGPWAYWPDVKFVERKTRPLSNEIENHSVLALENACYFTEAKPEQNDAGNTKQQSAREPGQNAAQKCSNLIQDAQDQYNRVTAAIGWAPTEQIITQKTLSKDTKRQHASKVRVVVSEPGFTNITRDDIFVTSPMEGQRFHQIHNLNGIEAMRIEPRFLSEPAQKEDTLGHALHVAHLISGSESTRGKRNPIGGTGKAPLDFGWRGFANDRFASERDVIADSGVVDREDKLLLPETHPTDDKIFSGRAVVFNRSYQPPEDCQLSSLGKRRHRAYKLELSEIGPSRGDEPQFFHVVAAPVACDSLELAEEPECRFYFPLACVGFYVRGVGVVAAERIRIDQSLNHESSAWAVMAKEPSNDPNKSQKNYSIFPDMMWLAAPGENIWSVDASIDSRFWRLGRRQTTYGFRARSGSSMAAPIVTALVARLKQNHANDKNFKWGVLKQWIFATSSPLMVDNRTDAKFQNLVVGMVNFERALGGIYDRPNIWFSTNSPTLECVENYEEADPALTAPCAPDQPVPCYFSGGTSKSFAETDAFGRKKELSPCSHIGITSHRNNEIFYDHSLKSLFPDTEGNDVRAGPRTISIMRNPDDKKIYALKSVDNNWNCDGEAAQRGGVRCSFLIKETLKQSEFDNCAWKLGIPRAPCFYFKAQNGSKVFIDLETVTHLTGLEKRHWRCANNCEE